MYVVWNVVRALRLFNCEKINLTDIKLAQGTNVGPNVMGGLSIDLTIVAIALLLRYTLSSKTNLIQIH